MSPGHDHTSNTSPSSRGLFCAEGNAMDMDPAVVANAKIAAGAAAGGIVRMFLRPARTLRETILLIFSNITCGFYFTKPFTAYWGIPAEYDGAVGALFGLIGLSVAQALLELNFRTLLARFIGKA